MDDMTKYLRGEEVKEMGAYFDSQFKEFQCVWMERFVFRSLWCLAISLHPSGSRERMLVSSSFPSTGFRTPTHEMILPIFRVCL